MDTVSYLITFIVEEDKAMTVSIFALLVIILAIVFWAIMTGIFCDKTILQIIVTIIIVIICLFSIKGYTKYRKENLRQEYNNGICECGGDYKFINYTQGYGEQAYVFQCDKCNKIITFDENPLE